MTVKKNMAADTWLSKLRAGQKRLFNCLGKPQREVIQKTPVNARTAKKLWTVRPTERKKWVTESQANE